MNEFATDAEGQRRQLRAEREARGEPPLAPVDEWIVVGQRLVVAGHDAGAADAWRHAVEADPGRPQAHLGLGEALLELGDPAAAAAAFRRAIDAHATALEQGGEALLDDPDEDPHYRLGMAEQMAGDPAAAVGAYRRCSERFPWFAEPIIEIARCELAQGAAAAAIAACDAALAIVDERRPKLRAEILALRDRARSGDASGA